MPVRPTAARSEAPLWGSHMNIADLRKDYRHATLDLTDVAADPLAQFDRWFREAQSAGTPEPNAMTLATADAGGVPSARILLLKGSDHHGFVFYTNYASRKGADLAANPKASLLFHWVELERQVRIEGAVAKVSAAESDEYYRSRPVGSRLGAWASAQSEVVASRDVLDVALADATRRFGNDPPRPAHWGGYRLSPIAIEFWQGRPSRLHDRIHYRLDAGTWRIERLAP